MNAVSFTNLRKIIAATDLTAPGEPAWIAALQIARLSPGCRVTVVHAVEPVIQMSTPELSGMDTTLPARVDAAEAGLKRQRDETPAFAGSDVKVVPGIPADVVTTAAEEMDSELIVITSHGRSGLKRLLLGSTAERIVHSATCAVLVLKPAQTSSEWGDGLHFDRIVAGYDGSPGADAALDTAVQLAAAHGGRVLLTEAVAPTADRHSAEDSTSESDRVQHTAGELEKVKARQSNPEIIDIETGPGKPWQYVCDIATQRGATLVVMGPHGHSRLGDFFLGSNAERVVRHAPCPVLITARPGTPVPAA